MESSQTTENDLWHGVSDKLFVYLPIKTGIITLAVLSIVHAFEATLHMIYKADSLGEILYANLDTYLTITSIRTIFIWITAVIFGIFLIKDNYRTRGWLQYGILLNFITLANYLIIELYFHEEMVKAECNFKIEKAENENPPNLEEKAKWMQHYIDFHKSHIDAGHKALVIASFILATGLNTYLFMIVKRFAYIGKKEDEGGKESDKANYYRGA